MSKYVDSVLKNLKAKNANEPEFIQAAEEVLLMSNNCPMPLLPRWRQTAFRW